METAEEFVCRIADNVGCEPDELESVIGMVKARDAAVALAAKRDFIAEVAAEKRKLEDLNDGVPDYAADWFQAQAFRNVAGKYREKP